jgi:hypothetical protein
VKSSRRRVNEGGCVIARQHCTRVYWRQLDVTLSVLTRRVTGMIPGAGVPQDTEADHDAGGAGRG